jgi:hypothetical protein
MHTRRIAAGLVVAGAMVGAYLSGLIPKFGGAGASIAPGTGPVATATTKAPPATKTTTPEKAPTKKTDAANSAEPAAAKAKSTAKAPPKMPVLDVYVKGHSYQIKDPSGSGELVFIKMDDVLKVARLTTGNEDGVKVRILRYRSAKYVAYSQLYEELNKAGLPNDAIRMPQELLEDPKPKPKTESTADAETTSKTKTKAKDNL